MIIETARRTEEETSAQRARIDRIVEENQKRVMAAFRHQRVSDSHFNPTTGYGYDDFGRETLEQVYAEVFGGEDALVRPQIVSGTHAITTALFGVLRPGDQLLYITGKPYDTLEGVIGNRKEDTGSLKDFGVTYDAVDLTTDGAVDYPAVAAKLSEKTKVVAIQRSKGYADRPSFSVAEIGEMISFVKEKYPEAIIFVDNC